MLCEKRSHQLIVIVKDIDLYMVSQSADANAFWGTAGIIIDTAGIQENGRELVKGLYV